MKVLLLGATGFIGTGTLHTLIADPSITAITVLTRRQLPASHQHPKVRAIIHTDYSSYPQSLLDRPELQDIEAVIWTLGLKITSAAGMSLEETRAVEVTGPLTLARICAERLAPALPAGKKLRFVYVSGALGERDQEKSLWFGTEARRMKGEVENGLLALEAEVDRKAGPGAQARFEAYAVRPGMVMGDGKEEGWATSAMIATRLTYTSAIRRDELARVMLELASKGSEQRGGRKTWENCDMVTLGRDMVKQNAAVAG